MGLGKTIQAIGVINSDPTMVNVLVVCPASLKVNWARELNKWLVCKTSIAVANGLFPRAKVVIINYDILHKHRAAIDARQWDLLIVDEVSMVDGRLGEDIMQFGVPVLALGDPAQLPPVHGTGFFDTATPNVMLTGAESDPGYQVALSVCAALRRTRRPRTGAFA